MKRILQQMNELRENFIVDGFKSTQYLCSGRIFISIRDEMTLRSCKYEVRIPLTFKETDQTGTHIPDYNITSTEEDTPHLVWLYDNLGDAVKKITELNK